jgi:hypothetical protein
MTIRTLAIASVFAVSACLGGVARADTIAGWDFSQYRGDGVLSTDGVSFTANTLPANYSVLDPTLNAGAESASYGTAYFDGSFGSTGTVSGFLPTAGGLNCQRMPVPPEGCATRNVDGPIRSNRTEPFGQGENAFDSLSVLLAEGQVFAQHLGMTASSGVSVVFEADLTPAGIEANDWSLSFGGRTFSGGGPGGGQLSCDPVPGCSSTVTVDFSVDGSTFVPAGSVQLDPSDQRFSVPLSTAKSDKFYVRLNLDATSGQPIIDNVAIEGTPLPEPGTTVQLLAGLAGLAGLHRLRR